MGTGDGQGKRVASLLIGGSYGGAGRFRGGTGGCFTKVLQRCCQAFPGRYES